MKVYIEETSKLSGKFVATFEDDNDMYYLRYDLEDWESQKNGGLIGGNYIQILLPEVMNLTFNKIYELDKGTSRKIYNCLAVNGWSPGRDFHK